MLFNEVLAKLKILTFRNKPSIEITQASVGRIIGLDRAAANKRFKRNSKCSAEEIKMIEDYYNVDLSAVSTNLDDLVYSEAETNFIKVPYYPDIEASCGNGVFAPDTLPSPEMFLLPANMLSKHSKYFIIPAVGNSMEKTIFDKELVILEDWTGKQIVDDKIYFFCYNNRHYLKRLAFNIDEVIVLSDNTVKDADGKLIYETKSIKGADIESLSIYGRFKAKVEDF